MLHGFRSGSVSGCVYSNGGRGSLNYTRPLSLAMRMYRTLEYLSGISDDDVPRLRSRGINHTNQLLHRTSLAIDRERLAKKTGISPDRLLEFAHQCTLLEVSGMERFVPLVRRLGINSMKDLRAQDPKELHAKVVEAVALPAPPGTPATHSWTT